MQTFLPYKNFRLSAKCLDNKRLNNQINESLVILRTLTGWYAKNGKKGWPNHPATKMWRGYELALAEYTFACLIEYSKRKDKSYKTRWDNIEDAINCNDELWIDYITICSVELPPWLGNPEFHSSHRSALLAKNQEWYSQFGWSEEPKIDYVWPKIGT